MAQSGLQGDTSKTLICGDFVITPSTDPPERLEGQTTSRQASRGLAHKYQVSDQQDTILTIGYVTWDTGERDVRALEVVTPNQDLRRLERGAMRMTITPLGPNLGWSELSQARVKGEDLNRWSTLVRATAEELDEGALLSIDPLLREAGPVRVGTREALLQDGSRRRFYLCAVYSIADRFVHVVAFVLTRVLPLLHSYRGNDE